MFPHHAYAILKVFLTCSLQMTLKVTHVDCFLYLKQRPVATKVVLLVGLDPIAAVWT